MIRLDSIKIKASAESLQSIDFSRMINKSSSTNEGLIISDIWQNHKKVDIGIKSIQYNKLEDSLIVEASAKILKNEYIEGINKNTIERVIQEINNTGIIQLNSERFIHSSDFLSCDVTDNILMNDAEIFKKLGKIPLQNKYEITPYNTKSNEGIVFKGKQKSFKERMIFYNKLVELMCSPTNKDFRGIISPSTIAQFKGIVRVENNLTSFKKIREYLNIPNQKLINVLNSPEKVNYSIFNKITKGTSPETMRLFTQYEGMMFSEILKIEGYKGIFSSCGYEWATIEQFLKTHNKGNYHRDKHQAIELYNQLSKDKKPILNIVQTFSEALYNVA
jgi:hypothetical protein